jgi:hypothetical protein
MFTFRTEEKFCRWPGALDIFCLGSGARFPKLAWRSYEGAVPCVMSDSGDAAELEGSSGAAAMAHPLGSTIIIAIEQATPSGRAARNPNQACSSMDDMGALYEHLIRNWSAPQGYGTV